jgi:pectate lyase
VKIENNYFQNSKDPIESAESLLPGFWDVAGNVFDTCTGTQPTTSNGSLTPPYPYTLDPTADLPTSVPANAGLGKM